MAPSTVARISTARGRSAPAKPPACPACGAWARAAPTASKRLASGLVGQRRPAPERCFATDNSAAPSWLSQPSVRIDNQSDPFSTIVKIDYGDELGDLLDTIQSLRNLGYNITRAQLSGDSKNKFYITDAETSEKVTRAARLEDIRQCIISNMVTYHPDSKEFLCRGGAEDTAAPSRSLGAGQQVGPSTTVTLRNCLDRPFTELTVSTPDRPGLLVDIVKTLKDCNINVVSAEVDTLGAMAEDNFMLTYHGEPLRKEMRMLVKNALQYYLAKAELENDESY